MDITAVASMTDNGGSTGRLREELGVLPPGDILKCVIALSPLREAAKKMMLKSLNGDRRLKGHKAGNIVIAMLSRYTGSFTAAIQALSEILEISGRVLPATINNATLVAELVDGSRIYGESSIDLPLSGQREQIRNLFLVPHHNGSITAYKPVINAIIDSDIIIIGPGDLYTSIIASLIIPGIKEAIQDTKARIFYILNIMTKYGETHNFKGIDFVQRVEMVLGRQIDGIIGNSKKPDNELILKYLAENSEFVDPEQLAEGTNNLSVYSADLLDLNVGSVRHDSKKLASFIQSIIFKEHFFECEKITDDPTLMQFPLKDSANMPIKDRSDSTLPRAVY
jgi:uncharacterized cofD-like protein